MRTPTRPKLEDAAKLIAGGKPPDWLAAGLGRVVDLDLKPAMETERLALSRSDLGSDVKDVEEAVELLIKKLAGQSAAGLLIAGGGPGDTMEHDEEVRVGLLPIKARIKCAKPSLRRPGRTKGVHPNVSRAPRLICATAVAVAWHRIRNQFPPPSATEAHRAADIIWRVAGGTRTQYRYAESGVGRWRRPFQDALPAKPTPEIELLRGRTFARFQPPGPLNKITAIKPTI